MHNKDLNNNEGNYVTLHTTLYVQAIFIIKVIVHCVEKWSWNVLIFQNVQDTDSKSLHKTSLISKLTTLQLLPIGEIQTCI